MEPPPRYTIVDIQASYDEVTALENCSRNRDELVYKASKFVVTYVDKELNGEKINAYLW